MAEQLEVVSSGGVLQGSFKIKTTKYDLSLTDTNVSWKKSVGKPGDEITIPIIDVVSVKTASSKSSKTGTIDSWILCYAQRKKNNHLRKASVVFIGEQSDCQEWTNRIQQALDTLTQRPKKILVLINPISGWSRGEKNYRTKVAPLFTEANIVTDVKVTERAHHTEEILAAYDLSTIDSIVFVGGDGMYYEVVNGLMNKKVKESGVNLNDPDMELPCLDLPIGIIPCGTGNGAAEANFGCIDVETAALSIIIGKRNNACIATVHCAGEFVVFSILLVGFGLWSELIYWTEQRRHLGVFRYPIVMINSLLVKSQRPMRLNIQYKVSSSDKTVLEQEQAEITGNKGVGSVEAGQSEHTEEGGATSDTSNRSEWVTVEKDYIGPISFNMNVYVNAEDSVDSLFNEFSLIALQPCTRMQMMKFLGQLIKRELGAPLEFVDQIKTTEYRIKVVNPSDPTSTNGILERLLDIDGEAVELKHPEFSVRHFPRRLWLFANVPEDFYLSRIKAKAREQNK